MNYRLATLLPEEALSPTAAGTKLIPIRMKEPISRIEIKYAVTKSLQAMTDHPAADITKIELVDGSDVLHSMTGFENQALCIFDRKVPSMLEGVSLINIPQDSMYGIDFGRWLHDPLLAFEPSRFNMPQLKITYNSLLSDTGGTVPSLQVMAHVFDEKVISPMGFLMSKEHHSENAPASATAHKYVELPTDYPYRRIMVRAFLVNYPPEHTISHVKIDEDNDKRTPWDVDIEDYCERSRARWQQVVDHMHINPAIASQYYFITPSNYFAVIAGLCTSPTAHYNVALGRTGGRLYLTSDEITTILGEAMGWCPNHCFDFECGDPKDIDDWYDVTKVGDLRLRVSGGGAGASGTYQVVIQQLRRY